MLWVQIAWIGLDALQNERGWLFIVCHLLNGWLGSIWSNGGGLASRMFYTYLEFSTCIYMPFEFYTIIYIILDYSTYI